MQAEGRGRQVTRRRLPLRPAYVVLAVLLVLFALKFLEKTRQIQALNRQEAALRYENQQTEAANAHMRKAIRYYRTDAYVQETARGILGYTLPGETTVEVRPIVEEPHVEVRAAPLRPPTPAAPPWQQWWNAFAG